MRCSSIHLVLVGALFNLALAYPLRGKPTAMTSPVAGTSPTSPVAAPAPPSTDNSSPTSPVAGASPTSPVLVTPNDNDF